MIFASAIPVLFALLRLISGKYIFSALTTLSCAVIALIQSSRPLSWLAALALVVSAAGDWFMAHKGRNESLYLLGIAGFFVGHILFIVYSLCTLPHHRFVGSGLVLGGLLAAALLPYLFIRVLPHVPQLLKIPVVLYTLVSIANLSCAVMKGSGFFALGVASLLFSDTMIAEADFVGNIKAGPLILPTYYLSHILIALSFLFH